MGFLAQGGVSRLPRNPELNTEQREVPLRASSYRALWKVPQVWAWPVSLSHSIWLEIL